MARTAFFGNQLGQTFQTENGKLAIYSSGVAGTTSLLIEARDAQTNLPAASRTLDVTIDALPYVSFVSWRIGLRGAHLLKVAKVMRPEML